jgi:HTH-type transcriptional regulator/antitoxin HipB
VAVAVAAAMEAAAMIKNAKQYRTTQARVRDFESERTRLEAAGPSPGVDPRLHAAQIDGVNSQIETMTRELREYDALRDGHRKVLHTTLEELPKALIQARIARGMTQDELAAKLELDRQQISDYEKTDYRRASFARIVAIARALELDIREEVRLDSSPRAKEIGGAARI